MINPRSRAALNSYYNNYSNLKRIIEREKADAKRLFHTKRLILLLTEEENCKTVLSILEYCFLYDMSLDETRKFFNIKQSTFFDVLKGRKLFTVGEQIRILRMAAGIDINEEILINT